MVLGKCVCSCWHPPRRKQAELCTVRDVVRCALVCHHLGGMYWLLKQFLKAGRLILGALQARGVGKNSCMVFTWISWCNAAREGMLQFVGVKNCWGPDRLRQPGAEHATPISLVQCSSQCIWLASSRRIVRGPLKGVNGSRSCRFREYGGGMWEIISLRPLCLGTGMCT